MTGHGIKRHDSAADTIRSSLQTRGTVNIYSYHACLSERSCIIVTIPRCPWWSYIELIQIGGLLLFFCRVIGDANSVGLSNLSLKLVP